MRDRLAPYALFALLMACFLGASAALSLVLPFQGALLGAQIIGLGAVSLALRRTWRLTRPEREWPRLGPPVPWRLIAASACAGVVFAFGAGAIAAATIWLVPALEPIAIEYAEKTRALIEPPDPLWRVVALFGVTLGAPIFEELAFRGTILPAQRDVERFGIAIVMNGALFGAIHMNPISFLPLAALGALLAALTLRAGSLWPAVFCHASLNLTNGLFLPLAMKAAGRDPYAVDTTSLEIALGLVLFVPASIAAAWGLLRASRAPNFAERAQRTDLAPRTPA